jgi:hypothetical protein
MTDEPRNSKVHILPIGFLSILFICITMLYGRPVIQNDGISYYALTLSLLEDGDFNLENQYRKHREVRVLHREGRIASYYSAGIALLYYPFLYTMDLFQGLREWKPYAQNVRFPFSHGFGFLIGSAIYSFFSVVFAYFMLFRHQKLSPWSALFIALLCFVGTPLMFYALTVPSFTHSSDTFLITAAFLLTISKNPFSVGFIRMRNVLLGLVLSLSVLLRNNNIVIVPILVLGLNYLEKEQGWKNVIRTWIEIFSGAIPILIVHVYFNFAQYGKLFATGYGVDVSRHVKKQSVPVLLDILSSGTGNLSMVTHSTFGNDRTISWGVSKAAGGNHCSRGGCGCDCQHPVCCHYLSGRYFWTTASHSSLYILGFWSLRTVSAF